jgi:hypothetical protein
MSLLERRQDASWEACVGTYVSLASKDSLFFYTHLFLPSFLSLTISLFALPFSKFSLCLSLFYLLSVFHSHSHSLSLSLSLISRASSPFLFVFHFISFSYSFILFLLVIFLYSYILTIQVCTVIYVILNIVFSDHS